MFFLARGKKRQSAFAFFLPFSIEFLIVNLLRVLSTSSLRWRVFVCSRRRKNPTRERMSDRCQSKKRTLMCVCMSWCKRRRRLGATGLGRNHVHTHTSRSLHSLIDHACQVSLVSCCCCCCCCFVLFFPSSICARVLGMCGCELQRPRDFVAFSPLDSLRVLLPAGIHFLSVQKLHIHATLRQ